MCKGDRIMQTLDETYLTVAEAATLLRVAQSTIRRWIRQGDVPAYRIGPRRVALKRTDLDALITSVQLGAARSHSVTYTDPSEIPKLTPEEKQQALEAMERLQRHSNELSARRGGKPFSPSWEILNELRDERTRQLME